METQKELVAATSQELADVGSMFTEGHVLEQRNVVIPKLLMQQGLSKFVGEGKAKMGDVCDSLTGEVIAAINVKTMEYDKPVRFVPFHYQDLWIIQEKQGDQYKFKGTEPVTSANENREWDDVVDGKVVRFTRCLYFYVLLERDPSIPYIISFKSTSLRQGKILYTQMFVKNQVVNQGRMVIVPPLKIVELICTKEQNDKGTFVVMGTKVCENTPMELIKASMDWMKVLKAGNAVADESDHSTIEVDAPSQPLSNIKGSF